MSRDLVQVTLVASASENVVGAPSAAFVAVAMAAQAVGSLPTAFAAAAMAPVAELTVVAESAAADHNLARGYPYAERERLYYFYSPHSDFQKVVVFANYYSYVQYPLFHPVDRSPCLRGRAADRAGGHLTR